MSKLGAVRLVTINKAGLLLVLPASLRLGARAHAAPSPSGAPSFTPQTLPFVFSPPDPAEGESSPETSGSVEFCGT